MKRAYGRRLSCRHALAFLAIMLCAATASAEVMLQWFETEWDEIHRRLPEVCEIGYDYMWLPSPCKAPTGLGTKWGNVGYNLYDRFDIGDVPQRGSLATRYGTRGSLRNMVDKAHQCDVKIIPDIIMNHNGNGPDVRSYPGMKPEDFHVEWSPGHANSLDYRRGPRMGDWHHGEGYGGTMWQELVSLIDIRTETDGRFTGGSNTPGWNFVDDPDEFVRHVGQYDRYPYGYGAENVREMLNRWIVWLGDAMDYDGLRLDAGKHVPWEFFGYKGSGFLHEAQWNFNGRRGYSDANSAEADQMFTNYLRERDDALIFAEILSYQGELAYWFGGQLTDPANNTRNPMRFIDYPLKQKLYDAFNSGNLASLTAGGGGIDPRLGITYAWGHDEAGPNKINLAYAYILTHVGFPMVYFTGNNITWDDNGTRTWMRPGYDSQALGDLHNDVPNLVWIHRQFARGNEIDRWNENDFFAYERYDDKNSNNVPDSGEGLLLVVLNDSGWDQTRDNVTCAFPVGTVLHDYTGNAWDITVYDNDGVSQVNVTAPGGGGQGWVCYAPQVADPVTLSFKQGASPAPTISWVVPGGIHADDKPRTVPRITDTNVTVDVTVDPKGTTVDSAMMKWGRGTNLTANTFDSGNGLVSGGYEQMNKVNDANWDLTFSFSPGQLPEGLNVVKARAFTGRAAGLPALFNTATKVVYVDVRGPEVEIGYPAHGDTIRGEAVAIIRNPDYTAYGMTVSIDGGTPTTAHEIMKGLWKLNLAGLSSGNHTMAVTTTEADLGDPRTVINTSVTTREFSVVTNAHPIALNHGEGTTIELPFFKSVVTAAGSPERVTLYWDGLELPFTDGGYSNTFNGDVIRRDDTRVETERLWGAFCNGQHFFEAERVDGGVTSRVSRRVVFDLYGINAIDSDGDALPDNVEMPFIDTAGAPGADAPWPGDNNKDFIPNDGEYWTRLNPYNHSTFYTESWDDQGDMDGDGYTNGEEVMGGYREGNIYKYSIYDAASVPPSNVIVASTATWAPGFPERGNSLTITYTPNEGPLLGASQVTVHIGHSARSTPQWLDVTNITMAPVGQTWQISYVVPSNATSVDFVCFDDSGTWDNNDGRDWQAGVQADTNRYFNMNGYADSGDYEIFSPDMKILAAVKSDSLYVATWGTGDLGGNDHFVYVTDELGDAGGLAPAWNKGGQIFCDTSSKPYLAGESTSDWKAWHNVSGEAADAWDGVLEGEINLVDAFGHVPEAVYVAAVAHGTSDGDGLNNQGPYTWNGDENVDIMEFLRVPISSIRDEDLDGTFDMGKPQMWTVVGTDTNDANYGLRRTFIDELAGQTRELTVILQPHAGGETVTDVELFSNINRRDFAVIEEDPATVTTSSKGTYFRAYPMSDIGGGRYSVTITLRKCGAYRINARYRVDGGNYVYYTDNGLRRDCAVVVSPTKTLDVCMYEMNPLVAEATSDDFFGRSTFEDMYLANPTNDAINTTHFDTLGVNMIWLQPIHPIGGDGRQIDPATGLPYDPGSPYAVQDYWSVNAVLGDPSTTERAMTEFTNFVAALDGTGVDVMLDGTFNHSAWDCQIGIKGVEMGITTSATDLIRDVRPQWYSKRDDYGEHASHYENGSDHDIATAPDRIDFGKWSDAADVFFGRYDALVQGPVTDTNNAWSSRWYSRHLLEEDRFEGHDSFTREVWEYFAAYPLYWLEKTGHPAATPKSESHKGIDGLRCDFAQGLPSQFWEYCINKTRSVKWDFLFMAESLDGNRNVGDSRRHGVGYRSSRQFDILNENLVFYWRDTFFNYYDRDNAAPYTGPTQQQLDDRRQAYDTSPLLLNLTSHDEIYPAHDPYRIFYAYCELAAIDGVPMMFYGQEAGAQNDENIDPWITSDDHNFARYETNFGKSIPNFKRYNHMRNIWNNRDWGLQALYGRVNAARKTSPALRSQGLYFLSQPGGGYNPGMFAVAKYEAPGVSASTQDVVFAFVNNNHWPTTDPGGNGESLEATFDLDADYDGANRFGIEAGKQYNLVDLLSTNPTDYVWNWNTNGSDLIANGIYVHLRASATSGGQAQYLKLVDVAVGPTYPDADSDGTPDHADLDDDNDGLPDWYEDANGLDPKDATGENGADGNKDGDGATNLEEYHAGTAADDPDDVLVIDSMARHANGDVDVGWPAKAGRDYKVVAAPTLPAIPDDWQDVTSYQTALGSTEQETDTGADSATGTIYRVRVRP